MRGATDKIENSIKSLEQEREVLILVLEEYLLVLGVEYHMLKAVINDLKDQMYLHADQIVNNMIADLINLENSILYAKQELRKKMNEPPQLN